MRKFLALAAALCFWAAAAGCGDEGGGPTGTWILDGAALKEAIRAKSAAKYEEMRAMFDSLPPDQRATAAAKMPSLDALIGDTYKAFDTMTMEMTLESGGGASFVSEFGGRKQSGKGTWKQDGEKILITDAERKEAPVLTFKDGGLWMELRGFSVPLRRK